jgi:heat-inducible transcriptional repressor
VIGKPRLLGDLSMTRDLRISPREQQVLTAILELYIATGEPVASQAVARAFDHQEGLSSATIRNVMAALAEAGLLEQPHTSSGRIPTAQAFRIYAESLMGQTRMGAATSKILANQGGLSAERQGQIRGEIEESYSGVHSSQQFLERTSHVLAHLSSGVGLALARVPEQEALEHIHFSRLSAGRVLAVVVTKPGAVLDRVLALDRDLTHTELEVAARFLNENFRGWTLDKIRTDLERRLNEERSEYDRLLSSVEELWRKGALTDATLPQTVFVEGVANLLASEMDREPLRQMLLALEAKQRLIELLNAYVDAHQQNVRVVVGLEDALPGLNNLVLVGAPAWLGDANLGTVAVIAPTRMHYQETIHAVSFVSQFSEKLFEMRRAE